MAKSFTVDTNVKVYFCDPQSPWQRGTKENTNGLLRQYFPKKTDLSGYTQADLNKVAMRLNQRPRKTLGYQTPESKLKLVLHRPVETAGSIGNFPKSVTKNRGNRTRTSRTIFSESQGWPVTVQQPSHLCKVAQP